MTKKPGLVLASNSPRRNELLSLGGWAFHIRPANVDESRRPGESPADYVQRLGREKAQACAASAHPGEVIIAADTIVTIDGELLGKPANGAEAASMLQRLRGRRHQVLTGLAVLDVDSGTLVPGLCLSQVPMRRYTQAEIEAYVLSGDPLDKAGAYAIQHAGFHPVEDFSGCFASVMGLPLCHLAYALQRLKIPFTVDIAARCQAALHYDCPISARVLNGEMIG